MRGRCRATKRCDYCGRLGAVENAEMVALDAVTHAPGLFVVLTTVDPFVTGETVRRDLAQTWKAVRARWPEAEYACFVEFTTGLSVWSGGHRRIHLNLLVKNVPVEDDELLQAVLLDSWGRRTRTTQLHVGPIYAAEGLVRYVTNLALHVMKDGQKPPKSYSGNLVRWSRGYFAEGATVTRLRARRSLKVKRRIFSGDSAEVAELEVAAAELDEWQLIGVPPVTWLTSAWMARHRADPGEAESPGGQVDAARLPLLRLPADVAGRAGRPSRRDGDRPALAVDE